MSTTTSTPKKLLSNKITATIVSILIATIAISLLALPLASAAWDTNTAAAVAAGMKWDFPGAANYNASATRLVIWNRYHDRVPTRTYNVIAPNPVGVGQMFTVVYFQPIVPPDALLGNNIRYEYYNVITKPDGSVVRLPETGTTTSDATGTNYLQFTPDKVGNWSVTTVFIEQVYGWYSSDTQRNFYGITLLSSNYTSNLVVQEEPVQPIGWTPTPLPTEYWTRPIEGQNTLWAQVSSNWYSNERDESNGGPNNRFQRDGTAPNSGHILWTRPTEDQGVIGGTSLFSTSGEVFNAGHQYQPRFQNQIILNGRLYYSPNVWWGGDSELIDAVDLRTGELLWEQNTTGIGMPQFGYYYDFDSPNQHGVTSPGWLFTSNFARAYQPARGIVSSLNIQNVPSGFEVVGPKGEVLRYVLTNVGTSTNPQYYLAQWNSSRVLTDGVMSARTSGNLTANVPLTPSEPTLLPPPFDSFMTTGFFGPSRRLDWGWTGSAWVIYDTVTSRLVNTTATTAGNLVLLTTQLFSTNTNPSYDWNVTIDASAVGQLQWGKTGQANPSIRQVLQNDIILGSNGSTPQGTGSPSFGYPENSTWWGISLKPGSVGKLVWMSTITTVDTVHNDMLSYQRAAEGVFVFVEMPTLKWLGFSMYNGTKLWETRDLAEFNPFGYFSFPSLMYDEASTIAYGKLFVSGYIGGVFAFDLNTGAELWNYTAPTDMSVFKYYTLMLGGVADGKLFVGTHEHSADTPLFKGNRLRVLDVNTGVPIFTMRSWPHPRTMAIADGILIYWNNYDGQIYAVGKGPSQTTVDAPAASVTAGSSVVIRGTVTDISAGTKQKEQAARFPSGVPAVSDASESEWMEYVYMQKERPTNATGVEVVLSVLDANNNLREIGKTTSDANGFYSFQWTPDIPGKFNVYASFSGTESYWPSHAETAFVVDPAVQAPAAPEVPPPPPTEMYVLAAAIAIIIAVAVVGIVLAMLIKRRA